MHKLYNNFNHIANQLAIICVAINLHNYIAILHRYILSSLSFT